MYPTFGVRLTGPGLGNMLREIEPPLPFKSHEKDIGMPDSKHKS